MKMLLLWVAALLGVTLARIERNVLVNIASPDHFNILWEFQFAAGGTFDLAIRMQDTVACHTALFHGSKQLFVSSV